MAIEPREMIDLQVAGVARWELHLLEEIIKAIYRIIIEPGDNVIDGGANAGMHTIPLARAVGEQGQVLAFEPIHDLASNLRRRLEELDLRNVRVREEALALRRGKARFFRLKNREAESSLTSAKIDPRTDELELFELRTVILDEIIPQVFGHWRFAKLDLEGAEFDALRGGRTSLMTLRPTIILEFGYHATAASWGYSQLEWDRFFDDIGYRLYDLAARPILHRPWGDLGSWIWYLIAVPKYSADESFILDGMLDAIEPIMSEWSRALSEARRPRCDP